MPQFLTDSRQCFQILCLIDRKSSQLKISKNWVKDKIRNRNRLKDGSKNGVIGRKLKNTIINMFMKLKEYMENLTRELQFVRKFSN